MKFFLFACAALCFSLSAAQSQFIKVNEFELEYEIAGSGNHTVLLEAGAGSAMTDWEPVFAQIAQQATVIRYSRVGNGNSTQIKRHFTSRDYADYASELLEKLNVTEPVIYVAHSYGGSVARDFAAAYPDKVKALLMLDPSSEHDVDVLRAIDLQQGNKEIAQIKLDDMKNGMSNNYLDFWSKRPLPDYPQIKAMPVTVIASVKKTENPANLFFSDQGRQLWGEHWHSWATAFPQGRAVLTDKSGHYVQFDEPDLVLAELEKLIALLEGVFLSPAASTEAGETIISAGLQQWHQQAISDGFDGQVLVMQAGKPLLLQAYGMADHEAGRAFTTDTVFDIGSITKQFTAAAIVKLHEQGKLQLNDTLGRFFPEAGDDKRNITLHQLLTHSAGLVNNLSGGDYSKISRSTFIKRVFRSTLKAPPGSTFSYSNAGYAVLGLVIERVSGQSYEQYLQQHLLQPAGLQHTGYRLPDWQALPLAAGYELKPDSWWRGKADGSSLRWGTPLEKSWDKDGPWWNLHANGGLLSTLGDLSLWLHTLQTETVLSKASTTLLFTPHVATSRAGNFYGYGWITEPGGQHGKVMRHGGSNGIFTTVLRYYANKELLIIFMTNNDSRFFPGYRDSLLASVFDVKKEQ